MNESSTQASDTARAVRQQETRNRQQTQAGLASVIIAVATIFIPSMYLTAPYDTICMAFGSAAIFMTLLYLNPESLRSRSGSLVPARCLAVVLWLLVVVGAAVSLFG